MQACSRAKLSPCKGSISAIAVTSAVTAITDRRTTPAPAASAIARDGPIRSRSRGPITPNTTTSAATDSDHSTLAVGGDIPAAFQRIIVHATKAFSGENDHLKTEFGAKCPLLTYPRFGGAFLLQSHRKAMIEFGLRTMLSPQP
jgi:hypothetical protein